MADEATSKAHQPGKTDQDIVIERNEGSHRWTPCYSPQPQVVRPVTVLQDDMTPIRALDGDGVGRGIEEIEEPGAREALRSWNKNHSMRYQLRPPEQRNVRRPALRIADESRVPIAWRLNPNLRGFEKILSCIWDFGEGIPTLFQSGRAVSDSRSGSATSSPAS